jgi:hypothetical protein
LRARACAAGEAGGPAAPGPASLPSVLSRPHHPHPSGRSGWLKVKAAREYVLDGLFDVADPGPYTGGQLAALMLAAARGEGVTSLRAFLPLDESLEPALRDSQRHSAAAIQKRIKKKQKKGRGGRTKKERAASRARGVGRRRCAAPSGSAVGPPPAAG